MTALSLTLDRVFAIDRDTMWRLWTEEEHAARWMRPSLTEYGPTKATVDARVGGAYRFELSHGGDGMSVIQGEYLEVEAPTKLVYTWSWEGDPHVSRVEVRFEEAPAGTLVHLVHSRLASAESVAAHEQGWIGCLAALADTLDNAQRR